MEHHYTSVNGIRLHYVAEGERGPLMLFVHGFPEFWYAWHEQLLEFGRDHRAVALDMRGYNLSDKPPAVEAYRAKHLVEDLRQLIAQLGEPAIVVAHDWGGALAWSLAIQHPQLVSRLVIVNAPHPVPFARALRDDPEQIAASQYMRRLRDPTAERVLSEDGFRRLAGMLRQFAPGSAWPSAEDLARYRDAWSQPGALTGGLNYYRASPLYPRDPKVDHDPVPVLAPGQYTVRVPTLVVWGERDAALLPVLLEGLDEVVPDLRVERIADATHWVAHEQPQQLNRLIRAFIGARAR